MGLQQLHSLVHKVTKQGAVFESSRPCSVCGKTGHNFNNCDELKDHDRLCKDFIWLQVASKRFANQISGHNMLPSNQYKEINQLKAKVHQLEKQVKISSISNNDESDSASNGIDSNDSFSHFKDMSNDALVHGIEQYIAAICSRKDFL